MQIPYINRTRTQCIIKYTGSAPLYTKHANRKPEILVLPSPHTALRVSLLRDVLLFHFYFHCHDTLLMLAGWLFGGFHAAAKTTCCGHTRKYKATKELWARGADTADAPFILQHFVKSERVAPNLVVQTDEARRNIFCAPHAARIRTITAPTKHIGNPCKHAAFSGDDACLVVVGFWCVSRAPLARFPFYPETRRLVQWCAASRRALYTDSNVVLSVIYEDVQWMRNKMHSETISYQLSIYIFELMGGAKRQNGY